jgi:hypothetical protein
MSPDLRRIIAVEAHRRRCGRYPLRVHSLGTGETYDIAPAEGGFRDLATGLVARFDGRQIVLSDGRGPIELAMTDDVRFDGVVRGGEPFTGRAGGGASVTLYEQGSENYFQFAVGTEADGI